MCSLHIWGSNSVLPAVTPPEDNNVFMFFLLPSDIRSRDKKVKLEAERFQKIDYENICVYKELTQMT